MSIQFSAKILSRFFVSEYRISDFSRFWFLEQKAKFYQRFKKPDSSLILCLPDPKTIFKPLLIQSAAPSSSSILSGHYNTLLIPVIFPLLLLLWIDVLFESRFSFKFKKKETFKRASRHAISIASSSLYFTLSNKHITFSVWFWSKFLAEWGQCWRI